jgi:hypothetical protein
VRIPVYARETPARQMRELTDCCIVGPAHRTEPASVRAVPAFRGRAPTGPLRPSIGARMKDPSNNRRSTSSRAVARTIVPVNRVAKAQRRLGLSRWRALEREQFLALVAPPRH